MILNEIYILHQSKTTPNEPMVFSFITEFQAPCIYLHWLVVPSNILLHTLTELKKPSQKEVTESNRLPLSENETTTHLIAMKNFVESNVFA